jgi:tRNA1(Val) A37 N6-methylase TrmN6
VTILSIATTFLFIAQESSGDVSSGELTLGGLVAAVAGNGVLGLWIRQAIKDRDASNVERRQTQAKYDDLAQQAFPLLSNAIPALDKVSESMQRVHQSDVDEFKQAMRTFTSQLRKSEKEG